eukprot:TRINITY_DN3763_c0_g1_i3.p1 TRINITY_DN3763_c0_g1~~TRINITY_DN3763_c0_g1_i3.p1  ORF type:complete len:162 (+),score=13.86 TRINITY_DN3763_c0_g1_i3:67-552(+)
MPRSRKVQALANSHEGGSGVTDFVSDRPLIQPATASSEHISIVRHHYPKTEIKDGKLMLQVVEAEYLVDVFVEDKEEGDEVDFGAKLLAGRESLEQESSIPAIDPIHLRFDDLAHESKYLHELGQGRAPALRNGFLASSFALTILGLRRFLEGYAFSRFHV